MTEMLIEDRAEQWWEDLRDHFNLFPEAVGEQAAVGTVSGLSLGPLSAYQVTGTPQVVRRGARTVRQRPFDVLKVSLPMRGDFVMTQDDRQVRVRPGQMVMYDTSQPYEIVSDQNFLVAVMAFSRESLSLPHQIVRQSLHRTYQVDDGPGAVLAGFFASVMRQDDSMGPVAERIGEAGLHLIAGTLSTTDRPMNDAAADAQRIRVLHYVRAHLSTPGLTHEQVAAAHHMSPRTLHRLFEHEPCTVTEYIRLQRLESARRDLTNPLLRHHSIAGVAARWGFTSPPHFTKAFQAVYGVTPSMMRRG